MQSGKIQVINAGCGCETKEGLWFVHYVLPLLMFYDFSEEKITKVRVIPGIELMQICPFADMVAVDKRLFLFPNSAGRCYVYDIELDRFKELTIDGMGMHCFVGAYRRERYIYVLPFRYDRVIKIDLENNNRVHYLEGFKSIYDEDDIYINQTAGINEESVVCAVPRTDSMLVYNIREEKWDKISTTKGMCNISNVACSNGKIYGFDYDNKRIIRFNMHGELEKASEGIGHKGAGLLGINAGNFLVDETYGSHVYLFDDEIELKRTITLEKMDGELTSPYKHCCWINGKNKIYGITKSNELIVIGEDNSIITKKLYMDATLWDVASVGCARYYKECIQENGFITLSDMINSFTK